MLVSKNAKICVNPNAKPKICITTNVNPQRVVSPMQNFHIGHVHFFFLCVDFLCVGSRFSVEYRLKMNQICDNSIEMENLILEILANLLWFEGHKYEV